MEPGIAHLTAVVIRDGEWCVARCQGSHRKLRHADGRTAIVPIHRELARGTLASVLRQARLTVAEFRAAL